MTKPKSKKKKRSNKFPLTLHATGQYCKKIRGKSYYFGKDKKKALASYLDQAAYLHTGKRPRPQDASTNLTLRTLCNIYLEHQDSRVQIGEITPRHFDDQVRLLRDFAKFIGPSHLVSDVSTVDIQSYRRNLIRSGKSPNTINNRIAVVKSMYNWAEENEVIDNSPNLKAVKKITRIKTEKPIFHPDEIQTLLEHASVQMKAMILLGLNCGFGCTDCAQLKWKDLNLKEGRVSFPRGKTGVRRNLILWPETIAALKNVPKSGELVFYTSRGNPWVRMIKSIGKDGVEKKTKDDAVTKAFSKLIKKTGIETEKGVGFYTLRRTAATLAARSGDPFAVQRLLGHADLKMASTYVQDVSEQTDRVVSDMRKLVIPGVKKKAAKKRRKKN